MAYTTIDDPSAYFHTQLFTGNGSTQSITNDGNSDLQPDWLWIKSRGSAHGHAVFDSNRGGNARLAPEGTQEERTNEGNVTFQTDGFNVTSSHPTTNNNSTNMVAWQWKANGGTTASNTSGSITSTVQANTTAGFSIVTYTGNGSGGATIGHGLGATPKWFFVKSRSTTGSWIHYHNKFGSTPENNYLNFTTAPGGTTSAAWNNTAPTTSVASLGSSEEVNGNGTTFVGYFFAEKQGYSKFGSYVGNNSTNGPFIYLGFKPRFVIIKEVGAVEEWFLLDTKRNTFNYVDKTLYASGDYAEGTAAQYMDFLSNGIKIRNNHTGTNTGGNTYIYIAFAEHPFVSSDGVPTTAR